MPRKKLPPRTHNKSREIASYDPLEAYLKELSLHKRLTADEEKTLALKYFKTKEVQAAYQLVTANLWLVVKIAREYQAAARNFLDLIQEGNLGLMEAVKNFDPYKDVRLPSYAVWWIKAYIIRFLIANLRLVKVGTTQAQRRLFFNLRKEKEKLEREGIFPAPKLIADRLNVKEHEVVEMEQRLGNEDVSVDAQIGETEDSLLNFIPNNTPNSEQLLDKQKFEQLLKEGLENFAKTLTDKEKIIYEKRLISEEKSTLQEISLQLNVSLERVRQIENIIKTKLKTFLTKNYEGIIDSIEF